MDPKLDHPHRVRLLKSQLAKHVRTDHPFGACVLEEAEIRRWSMDELRTVHEQLHNGSSQ